MAAVAVCVQQPPNEHNVQLECAGLSSPLDTVTHAQCRKRGLSCSPMKYGVALKAFMASKSGGMDTRTVTVVPSYDASNNKYLSNPNKDKYTDEYYTPHRRQPLFVCPSEPIILTQQQQQQQQQQQHDSSTLDTEVSSSSTNDNTEEKKENPWWGGRCLFLAHDKTIHRVHVNELKRCSECARCTWITPKLFGYDVSEIVIGFGSFSRVHLARDSRRPRDKTRCIEASHLRVRRSTTPTAGKKRCAHVTASSIHAQKKSHTCWTNVMKIYCPKCSTMAQRHFDAEASVSMLISRDVAKNNNILIPKTTFTSPTFSTMFAVYDYAAGGSIFSVLSNLQQTCSSIAGDTMLCMGLPNHVASVIVSRIGKAIACIHRLGIVHCDVKLENVLMLRTSDPTSVVLGDFGLSEFIGSTPDVPLDTRIRERRIMGLGTNFGGSLEYASPEFIDDIGNCFESDVWALGVLAFALVTGQFPFDVSMVLNRTSNTDDLHCLIRQHYAVASVFVKQTMCKAGVDACAVDVIAKMLEQDVYNRLKSTHFTKYPWLSS